MHEDHAAGPPALPLTVQLGFAGPRRLFEAVAPDEHAQLREELKAHLASLHRTLGLDPAHHFFTALSQLAIGADTVFTELVAELGWPQRILLPQARTEFLSAAGRAGPDFDPAQRAHAEALLASPHIIEERVVSTANRRSERFEETNLRILEEADVLLCLQLPDSPGQPGGTAHLIERGLARRQRMLVLTLRAPGTPGPLLTLSSHGQGMPDIDAPLPHCVQDRPLRLRAGPGDSLPGFDAYVDAIKQGGSDWAGRRRRSFENAAVTIIWTHIAATVCALAAMKLPHEHGHLIGAVLGLEILLLLVGLFTHLRLHNAHALRDWAMARLCAELARSARSLRGMPVALDHLRQILLPLQLQGMIKTLNVLHLRECRQASPGELEALRSSYLAVRIDDPRTGQKPYYGREMSRSKVYFNWASRLFLGFSVIAPLATASKFVVPPDATLTTAIVGAAAVLLPVIAVACMSFAGAMDWEARAHTFQDMHDFIALQAERIGSAASMRELTGLVVQTEARLLGETLAWFGRRAYVGVA